MHDKEDLLASKEQDQGKQGALQDQDKQGALLAKDLHRAWALPWSCSHPHGLRVPALQASRVLTRASA